MGTFSSKAWDDVLEVTHPTTPTQRYRRINIDPRSPSEEISRTPIQVEQTPKLADETECVATGESLDNKGKHLKLFKMKNMANEDDDRRSPSVNVHQTPIEEKFINIRDKENSNNSDKNLPIQRGPKKLFAEKTEGNQLSVSNTDCLRISVQKKEFKKGKEDL